MPDNIKQLAEFDLGDAGFEVAPPLKARPGTLGAGSRNLIGFGLKNRRATKGLAAVGGKSGSRLMFNAGGKLGGLGDVSTSAAQGSVDVYLRNTIWFMGFGQLYYDGASIPGAVASTVQKILVRYNGSYTHANSGPYDAGLPQPSAPDVAARTEVSNGFRGRNAGLRSYMIASVRSWTGDRSRASYVSETVEGENCTDRLVFPQAPVGGTGWVVFASKQGFGGVGVHYRLRAPNRLENREFLETDIERTVRDVATNSTDTITSATAAFTSADIGKHVLLDNGSTTFETTIRNVSSATTAILADAVPFTDTAVEGTFTAYVDGILRAVEIEYDDTDLTSEAAWIADYPPPPAVASFPLVDVRVVAGCLSDAATDATVADAGTCLAVSERNYPGSYDPLKLLYLPEKFVGTVGRSTDMHTFVFCENWTGMCQYTGETLGPACTISTLWSDTGFKKQQNVCLAYGRLYGFSAKGSAVRLQNAEEPDTTFAEPVRAVFSNWDPEKVVVQFVPGLDAVMFAHKREAYLFYIQTERWMPPVYLSDFAAGEIVSAQALDQTLYLTMDSGSSFDLYEFDRGGGSIVSAVTNYVGTPNAARPKTIHELAETVIVDSSSADYWVSLHRNGEPIAIDDAAITAGSNILQSLSSEFSTADVGKWVLLFGALSSGLPMLARIGSLASTTAARLVAPVRPLGSTAVNAEVSVTNGHAIFAAAIFERTSERIGSQHKLGKILNLRNCFSYAIGISMKSDGTAASPVKAIVLGAAKEGRAGGPS